MILSGFKILVTRPAHQALALTQLIHENGGETFFLPCIEILKPQDLTSLKTAIAELDQFEIAIFNSANAVHYAVAEGFFPCPNLKIIAIGTATARTLETHGIVVTEIPVKFSSEELLKLSTLKNVINKRLVVFCGEESKPLLLQILIDRGAIVHQAICYRRQLPSNIETENLIKLKNNKIDFITSYSVESLKNLDHLIKRYHLYSLHQIPIVVINSEMKDLAQNLAWKTIIIAEQVSDAAVIDALSNFCKTRISHEQS